MRLILLLLANAVLTCPSALIAQDQAVDSSTTGVAAPAPSLQKRLGERAQELIESASFFRMVDDEKVNVPIRKKSLILHNDSERGELGGMWLATDEGQRPIAVAGIWTKLESRHWVCSMRSLSPEPGVGGVLFRSMRPWTPKTVGMKFAPMPQRKGAKTGSMKPAKSANLRFSQMKLQARRFGGHENWQGKRHELRLLPTELYRYESPKNGIVDGAIFSLAHNQNTECFLMIEVQEKDGELGWHYALGRFGFAELRISIDDKEIWKQPQVNTEGLTAGPKEAYYQGVFAKDVALQMKKES